MAFDVRLKGADFEVAIDSPAALVGYALGEDEVQFGRFVIEGRTVVGEAVSVAVDAVNVVSSDWPESR